MLWSECPTSVQTSNRALGINRFTRRAYRSSWRKQSPFADAQERRHSRRSLGSSRATMPARDGAAPGRKGDRNRPRLPLQGNGRRSPVCQDDVGLQADQLLRQSPYPMSLDISWWIRRNDFIEPRCFRATVSVESPSEITMSTVERVRASRSKGPRSRCGHRRRGSLPRRRLSSRGRHSRRPDSRGQPFEHTPSLVGGLICWTWLHGAGANWTTPSL